MERIIRFVIDAVLIMKQNKSPSELLDEKPERKFRVIGKCDVIIHPDDDEIIRQAEIGEILFGMSERKDMDDNVAIIQDGERAYVRKEALSPVELDQEPLTD